MLLQKVKDAFAVFPGPGLPYVDNQLPILHYLMEHPVRNESIEYNDNRLALHCAQQGKCAITGKSLEIGDIYCYHKTRRADGGDDSYSNLILVYRDAHILLHAMWKSTIEYYMAKLALNAKQKDKIISTFLESYDWNCKTIVPFCTSGSSPIGSSSTNLESLTSGAEWLPGRRFSGSASQDELLTWADSLDLNLN